ncbi:hypothetical protein D922_02175 [Enterococcus faecalis 06-MB-DW-09]|jgi:hypothetical protein|nr:hypothetical protein D922_02175 [Enterococcus faecalis 06-MB-DW-09]
MMNPMTILRRPLKELTQYDDEFWANYLFMTDPIACKYQGLDHVELIVQARQCGKTAAKEFLEMYGHPFDRGTICKQNKLLLRNQVPLNASGMVLGQFHPPNQLFINKAAITQVAAFLENRAIKSTDTEIANLVFGHEFFHWIEEQQQASIYTRTKKVQLRKFLGIPQIVNLRVLSEIAAMVFTKEINDSKFNPCLLDCALIQGKGDYYESENISLS